MKELSHYNALSQAIIGCAMRVHSGLGPGLLESAYEICLQHELEKSHFNVARQIPVPVQYDGLMLDAGYRLDLVVEGIVVVELKAVERLQPIHTAQLLSYLRLGGYRLGLLMNFNVVHLRDGVKRVANDL